MIGGVFLLSRDPAALAEWYRRFLGWELDVLEMSARLHRHDFLLTVAPLPIVGGTGSPVNPIATF